MGIHKSIASYKFTRSSLTILPPQASALFTLSPPKMDGPPEPLSREQKSLLRYRLEKIAEQLVAKRARRRHAEALRDGADIEAGPPQYHSFDPSFPQAQPTEHDHLLRIHHIRSSIEEAIAQRARYHHADALLDRIDTGPGPPYEFPQNFFSLVSLLASVAWTTQTFGLFIYGEPFKHAAYRAAHPLQTAAFESVVSGLMVQVVGWVLVGVVCAFSTERVVTRRNLCVAVVGIVLPFVGIGADVLIAWAGGKGM